MLRMLFVPLFKIGNCEPHVHKMFESEHRFNLQENLVNGQKLGKTSVNAQSGAAMMRH